MRTHLLIALSFLLAFSVEAQEASGRELKELSIQLSLKSPEALRMAMADMKQFGEVEDGGFDAAVKALELNKEFWLKKLQAGDASVIPEVKSVVQTLDKAMLRNPLIKDYKMIYLRREVSNARFSFPENMGFPSLNSHCHTSVIGVENPWQNQIMIADNIETIRQAKVLHKPTEPVLVTDLEIDFEAKKVLFTSIGENKRWHIYERNLDGTGEPVRITPTTYPDINYFDACYLPDGNIVFGADASYQGLPCEGGSRPMAQLFLLDRASGRIRQLTFEQDSDWCPTTLNNGRVMYLRWEYSDISHYYSRILMSMNPDGTNQAEYYGSNSYFPNSYFYARPIPNHSTMVVGIVGGHHGVSRSGRLILLDPEKGRKEADGVVAEIPHRGRKVEPIIVDRLVDNVLPQFLHPYPINEKYFLVSAKVADDALWALYLVDVFDNMTLIKEEEGVGLFDPILLREQPTPPVIPDRVDMNNPNANVFITDIYEGEGLKGVPRGSVKKLRLFSYHFAHMASGGHQTVGVESSWDVKRILGTVNVEADGSAFFTIPANTPISIQPLDSLGRALQLMRSWFVGMPGENVSCIGCHENQNMVTPVRQTIASRRKPEMVQNWQGAPRPFGFRYEVQPILDKNCLSCHNGVNAQIPNFRKADVVTYEGKSATDDLFFGEKGYMNLHPYVFRPGPESDNEVVVPLEYHASVSELVQMLQRDHHDVRLTDEEWEKLYAWIDLNVPYRGKWAPPSYKNFPQDSRRKEMAKAYAGIIADPEAEFDSIAKLYEGKKIEAVRPVKRDRPKNKKLRVENWPMNQLRAELLQANFREIEKEVDLGNGKKIAFRKIPAGRFVMGDTLGYDDERVQRAVTIDKPFYMAKFEVSNEIYALFNPTHNSRYIDQHWKDHSTPGYPANKPNQPVIRISYEEAEAFCKWLSEKSGLKCSLPTEEQWEWACRAGSGEAFWFGGLNADYSQYENFADISVRKFPVTWNGPGNPLRYMGDNEFVRANYDFIPRDDRFDDSNMIVADVDEYYHNPWGLYNMHGNVAEWTSSNYTPIGNEITDRFHTSAMKVVKGGSWRDRPERSIASAKRYYMPHQKPFNVGFRIVITE